MLKTKLYFLNNNKIDCKEEYINLNLKTGNKQLDSEEIIDKKITYKLIQTGIFHSYFINKLDKDTLFFNKQKFCELLSKNENLLRLSKPGEFLRSINFYITEINDILEKLSTFFIESIELEKKINIKIEEFRLKDYNKSKELLQLLLDYRNFTYNLRVILYQELHSYWNNFKLIKENLKNDKKYILNDINDFINLKKNFDEFNDTFESRINFFDNRFYLSDFKNQTEIKKIIIEFSSQINKAFNEILDS